MGLKHQWKDREGWIEKKQISGLSIFFFQLQHRNHAQMYLFILFICLCYSKKRKLKGKKSRERKHTHPQQSFKGYQVRQIFWHQWINAQDLALSAVSQMCNITSLFHKRHAHTWLAGYLIQASGKTWGKKKQHHKVSSWGWQKDSHRYDWHF